MRYPQSYFKYKKVQKELEKEKNFEWLNSFKDRKVVLVCGGAKARQVINFFQINQVNSIVAICDNDESKWGRMRQGIEIKSPQEIIKIPEKKRRLIICSFYYKEIEKQLREMGITDYHIYVQHAEWIVKAEE